MSAVAERVNAFLDVWVQNPHNTDAIYGLARLVDGEPVDYTLSVADLRELVATADAAEVGPTSPKVATADRCGGPGKGTNRCGRPLGHPGAHMDPNGGPAWWLGSGA